MKYRTLGRLGWPVSEIGHGLWGVGSWSGSNDEESEAAIERSLALGCTFYDTAFAYGNGKSERLLGRVLARHPDANVTVASKIPPKNHQWPAQPDMPLDDVFPPDHIRRMTEASLANLGRPSIDLQQFHVWTDAWATSDSWQRAVDDLKREGLVRAFGISVNRWEPTNVIRAIETGLVDTVQVVYNLFDQDPEDELFPACRERGVGVVARVPFDEGSLTDSLTRETRFPESDWRAQYFAPGRLEDTLDRVDRIREDLPPGMSMPELALRFILSSPDVSTVIPGMRRLQHVDANLRSSDGRALPAPLVARLRRHRWQRTYVVR